MLAPEPSPTPLADCLSLHVVAEQVATPQGHRCCPSALRICDTRLMPGWHLSGGICGVGQGAYIIHWFPQPPCDEVGVLDLGNNWRDWIMLSSPVVAFLSVGYSSLCWPRP